MRKHLSIFSGITLLSRFFGLLRDMLIANAFGTSISSDIFFAAFRIPNLLRSIFAEGAFSGVFLPIFSRLYDRNRVAALEFSYKIQLMLMGVLFITFITAEIFMEKILLFFAPGIMGATSRDTFLTIARIIFPYIIFIALTSLYCAMLQSRKKFAPTAFCPIIMNICLIATVLLTTGTGTVLLFHMSYAIVLSGIIQMLFLLLLLERNGMLPLPSPLKFDTNSTIFFRKFLPAALSAEMYQINIFVDTFFASTIPCAISFLYYSDRIIQLPLALIGIALNTVILSLASDAVARTDTDRLIKIQNRALGIAIILGIPATVGVIFTAQHIIESLFLLGGKFDSDSVINTTKALKVFAFALPAHILNKIFLAVFFAIGNTRIPTIFSLISVLLNIVMNYIFVQYYSYVGIIISSCIAAWFNAILMIVYLKKEQIFKLSKKIPTLLRDVFFSTSLMIFFLQLCNAFTESHQGILEVYVLRIASLMVICATSVGIYFLTLTGLNKLCKNKEY
ncbi:integral membrane protein MviN [Neorickettsia helminthoeca str. Oregon]|uniref:Probable lipid II flippase MurJ n=1 Tax=Neorickettsia helminthoeca str. Oregon TaxID=1286528 RepID=X5GWS6_9RICK|nr:murein biosynthesis integral membrane protein MurJ [Neorickettsia helminthoeca]AHX11482.1 integral membrane protein MviN [Neorickettsia helminthoeca str. Oregon]